jgi:hypothetical protein
VILTNVQITGNTGDGIRNRYLRFSGRGINLTLNNTTIADNTGWGVYTEKIRSGSSYDGANYPYDSSPEADANKRAFPVYIRFRNSVVYGNTSGASMWDWTVFSGFDTGNTPGDRETCAYSLLEGMTLSGSGNLPPATDPLLSAAYRPGPGSPLVNAGNASLYPSRTPSDNEYLPCQLFWNIGGTGGLDSIVDNSIPLVSRQTGEALEFKNIFNFLDYDNSFNIGDLRDNNLNEGPKTKPRPGALDIGAYEQ